MAPAKRRKIDMAVPVRQNESKMNPGNQPQSTEPNAWQPLLELQRLNDQLSRSLGGWGDLSSLLTDAFTPLADVEETDDGYLVEIELPGVKKGDIEISMEGRRLTVSGERKEKERAGILRRRTRSVGQFHYEVVLPGAVDEDAVSASLDGGVLTVRVPKRQSDRPRRIQVK
jgi:HSP20 family protein